ncbi:hypothetical protein NCS56_00504100 [Fusarium sp. Ph1]|nr:hypothetical protein NCS56_00504100 [Fusarium sp. Ph1]
MTQRNQDDCLSADGTEENERQPDTIRDKDENLTVKQEIHHSRDEDFVTEKSIMQSAIAENQDLPPGVAGVLLSKIRDKMLFRLSADTNDVPKISLINGGPSITPIIVNGRQRVDLYWIPGLRQGDSPSAQMTEAVRRAWPRNRNVEGITQIILESDGTMPRYDWLSQQPVDSLSRLDLQDEEIDSVRFSAYESLWHKWCLDEAESQQAVEDRSSTDDVDTSSLPRKFRGQAIYFKLDNYKNKERLFPLDQVAIVLSYDEPFLLPPEK